MLNTRPTICNQSTRSLLLFTLLLAGCGDPAKTTPDLPPDGPGTVREDANGHIFGTGWKYYFYPDGKTICAKDAYLSDKPIYSAWFKPDGTMVAEQHWVNGTGVQYYLWDDGTVKAKMPMLNGLANGTATYFKPDGTLEKTVDYKDGKPAEK